jgi:hypothetical protein
MTLIYVENHQSPDSLKASFRKDMRILMRFLRTTGGWSFGEGVRPEKADMFSRR